jgi:hypothetical protein
MCCAVSFGTPEFAVLVARECGRRGVIGEQNMTKAVASRIPARLSKPCRPVRRRVRVVFDRRRDALCRLAQ